MKFHSLIKTAAIASFLTIPLTACPSDDGGDDEVGEEEDDTAGETTSGEDTTEDGTTEEETTEEESTTEEEEETTEEETTGGEEGRVRLMHLGVFPGDENTGVDIFVNGEAPGITFEFKQGTDYVALPVGTYDFDIVPAGGTIDDSVFTVEGFAIEAGVDYAVFASGYLDPGDGDGEFGVAFFPENPADIAEGDTRLNVIHAAALGAFNPVDVWLVDENCDPTMPLLEDFPYLGGALDFDVPVGPLSLGLDVGQDATVDACFFVPELPGGALINVYAVNTSEGVPSLIAHLPDGSIAEVNPEG